MVLFLRVFFVEIAKKRERDVFFEKFKESFVTFLSIYSMIEYTKSEQFRHQNSSREVDAHSEISVSFACLVWWVVRNLVSFQ